MSIATRWCVVAGLLTAVTPSGGAIQTETTAREQARREASSESVSTRLIESLEDPGLQALALESVERSPAVAAASARARAAARGAPQAASLPDPMMTATAFVKSPETRTGPQRLSLGISQALPWKGKLGLREDAARLEAAALEAEAEAKKLEVVTEVRRLYRELSFLDRYEEITTRFLTHLMQHEEVARARYATGVGLGQGVVKLQAEITRVETQLLEVESKRISMAARLNALRDWPATTPLPPGGRFEPVEMVLDEASMLERALRSRPEVRAADARIAAAEAMIGSAVKAYRPDFTVGVNYTIVDPRDDLAASLQPPQGNGDDIIGIQGGVTLPLRRARRDAAEEEARERRLGAEESKREVIAGIRRSISELDQRLSLSWRRLRLVEDLLLVQAEEALQSAQAAYVAGTLNALDLLDAEHVLYETQTAIARARADYLVGIAELEGALGAPLDVVEHPEGVER
jgi:outer membrane protein TolC